MTAEAQLPRGWRAIVQKMIDDSISKFQRSGFLRNASINGGAGFTVGAGGKWIVRHPDGSVLAHLGAYDYNDGFNMPDGSRQPMALLYRADGTLALAMYDPDPASGGFQQFLAFADRTGSIWASDDTDSGQGMARPFLPGVFYRARSADWPSSTSGTFETIYKAEVFKQQPRMSVALQASMDTSGQTGEARVLVNGATLGTVTIPFGVSILLVGPGAVAGGHMDLLTVEIQARRTGASGTVRIAPLHGYGRQS